MPILKYNFQGEGNGIYSAAKKMDLKRPRKISFGLMGYETVMFDVQLKKRTGFRTKSRSIQVILYNTCSLHCRREVELIEYLKKAIFIE